MASFLLLNTIGAKRIVPPKMKMLSSFPYPFVIPNVNVFFFFEEHKKRYFKECWCQFPLTFIIGTKNTMEVNGKQN